MDVISGGKWSKEIDCEECGSTLRIYEEDLFAVNTAVAYAGEVWDPALRVECVVCTSSIPIDENSVPDGIVSRLFREARDKGK